MIDYFKYRLDLARLFKKRDSVDIFYRKAIQKARKEGKTRDDIACLMAESSFENQCILEEISILVTNHLILKAKRRFVPIPSRDEPGMWDQCCVSDDRFVLTNAGISNLRSALRHENKEISEIILKIVAAITGMLGAATGLIAVWFKK